jgi:hypothetical protein
VEKVIITPECVEGGKPELIHRKAESDDSAEEGNKPAARKTAKKTTKKADA